MRTFQIRSRGQIALFAGIWLVAFVPFFQFGALVAHGYAKAIAQSAAANNFAPLVLWAHTNLGLAIAYPIIEVVPLVLIIRLPELLQTVTYGERGGRVGQWCGVAGLALIALVTLVNMVQLVSAAQQIAPANQMVVGAHFRIAAIVASLIADILGDVLLLIWLISVNVPLVRIGGFERVIGIVGVLSAALFAATAGLVIFNPQQSQGAIAGSSLALFGLWLILTGFLLIQRAPALGTPIGDDNTAQSDAAPDIVDATPGASS
jgi:hypothetical protein